MTNDDFTTVLLLTMLQLTTFQYLYISDISVREVSYFRKHPITVVRKIVQYTLQTFLLVRKKVLLEYLCSRFQNQQKSLRLNCIFQIYCYDTQIWIVEFRLMQFFSVIYFQLILTMCGYTYQPFYTYTVLLFIVSETLEAFFVRFSDEKFLVVLFSLLFLFFVLSYPEIWIKLFLLCSVF